MSKATLWAGRVLSALAALFLLVDASMKLVKPAPVVEATVELVATHVRVGGEAFSVALPVIFGALLWGGLYVRDERLRSLVPWRRRARNPRAPSSATIWLLLWRSRRSAPGSE